VKWIQSELTRVDPIISDTYPMSSKYFLQRRGVPVLPICRKNTNPLTIQQKQKLDEIYSELMAWHERLNIKKGV